MSTGQITELLTAFAGYVWSIVNTTFATAVIGSLAGAFAGAYGAQLIAERSKTRELLLAEIRNTNAAILVAPVIFSFFISLKRQHMKPLKEKFDSQNEAFQKFSKSRQQGTLEKNNVFQFQADLATLPIVLVPTNVLQSLAFEKISLNGRPLRLATTLTQVAHSVDEMIQKRNHLIAGYKADSLMSLDKMLPLYFGTPDGKGNTDRSYPDALGAIYTHTDDCIFFSHFLCLDLTEHGERLRKKYSKKFGKDAPEINKVDFSDPLLIGLLPDKNNYPSWI